ncbi:unnamed protein product [Microthlaspi erraticum]|uniref:Uncharacterized protein n=1 Tax=Microthlaspi erraticum TaxID=1685480 RepID=A0A6D2JCK0_9BRAS|nr:unnamed protein product [Microthlaspi erraticum]
MKSFGSTIGRNLFSTETCPVSDQTEPMEDLECLKARETAPKALVQQGRVLDNVWSFLGAIPAHTRPSNKGESRVSRVGRQREKPEEAAPSRRKRKEAPFKTLSTTYNLCFLFFSFFCIGSKSFKGESDFVHQ